MKNSLSLVFALTLMAIGSVSAEEASKETKIVKPQAHGQTMAPLTPGHKADIHRQNSITHKGNQQTKPSQNKEGKQTPHQGMVGRMPHQGATPHQSPEMHKPLPNTDHQTMNTQPLHQPLKRTGTRSKAHAAINSSLMDSYINKLRTIQTYIFSRSGAAYTDGSIFLSLFDSCNAKCTSNSQTSCEMYSFQEQTSEYPSGRQLMLPTDPSALLSCFRQGVGDVDNRFGDFFGPGGICPDICDVKNCDDNLKNACLLLCCTGALDKQGIVNCIGHTSCPGSL